MNGRESRANINGMEKGSKKKQFPRYQQVDMKESCFVFDELVVHEDEKIKSRWLASRCLVGSHDFGPATSARASEKREGRWSLLELLMSLLL
jgi:hypothetical protein